MSACRGWPDRSCLLVAVGSPDRGMGLAMMPIVLFAWILLGVAAAVEASPDGTWQDQTWRPAETDWSEPPSGQWPGEWNQAVRSRHGQDQPLQDRWRDVTRDDVGGGLAQPQYRFRGDPPPDSRDWSVGQGESVYRFRPPTEREAERWTQSPGWRPVAPERASPSGAEPGSTPHPWGLMDALTPRPRTFGYEPSPW